MTRYLRPAVLAAAVLAASAPLAAQQRAVDESAIVKEVNAFMDQYWALWSAGRIDDLATRVYHPFGQLSNAGHASIPELKERFPDTRKALLAGGYGRSNMPNRNICVLSATVAIVSGRGIRYLKD